MRVYFAGSSGAKQNYEVYRKIISYMQDGGHQVLKSWIVEVLGNHNVGEDHDVLVRQETLLRNSDLMIVESSTPSFGIGYLMHQAIRLHIPILCLYPEGHNDKDLSTVIAGNDSSLLSLHSYNAQNLRTILNKQIHSLGNDELIKFNFLANKEITAFLEKNAAKQKKSKSEYLRDVLNEIIRKKENL